MLPRTKIKDAKALQQGVAACKAFGLGPRMGMGLSLHPARQVAERSSSGSWIPMSVPLGPNLGHLGPLLGNLLTPALQASRRGFAVLWAGQLGQTLKIF